MLASVFKDLLCTGQVLFPKTVFDGFRKRNPGTASFVLRNKLRFRKWGDDETTAGYTNHALERLRVPEKSGSTVWTEFSLLGTEIVG